MEGILPGQFDDAEQDPDPSTFHLLPKVDSGSDDSFEDEDDLGDWDWEDETSDFTKKFNAARANQSQPNASRLVSAKSTLQPTEKAIRKYVNKINIERFSGPALSGKAAEALQDFGKRSVKGKDKSDRATVEQVLDPRTRMILFKLLDRGIISEVNGCINTGKEANVYYATSSRDGHPNECAIKIYKTSILTFKDRDKYVTGEYRFRHGYSRHNPRKMVRTWAEKEMRNLTRLHTAGILCPTPILLRSHVLVMSFIGSNGWPAPLLKDVGLSDSKWGELYLQCIKAMRVMFHQCHLVHADLSEFNVLYHRGDCYLIDVSQSVEHDHPHALEFLRKDCNNITEFFGKKGVGVMSVRELFDFVTDPNINDTNMEDYLEKAQLIAGERLESGLTDKEKVDEEVFKRSYIPRTLDEVENVTEAQKGKVEEVFYRALVGLKSDLSGAQQVPTLLENDASGSGSDVSDEESESDESDEKEVIDLPSLSLKKEEESRSRKENKKLVKEANRERRKHKMAKHMKKQKEKQGRQRRGKKP
ncbi:serine/threonine-protein kinase RIO1-like [Oscarella lobularis]|uniref:serine/threonine-protein kinase RIO1-like n=1 Tax=Oscarella lobularis TaxID=121494 RepID=UPI003313D659